MASLLAGSARLMRAAGIAGVRLATPPHSRPTLQAFSLRPSGRRCSVTTNRYANCSPGGSTKRDTAVLTASLRISISKGLGWAESATSAAASIGSAVRTSRLRSRSSARL